MEEIQIGEYVRIKDGLIGQFYNIEEGYDGNIIVNFEEFAYEYEDVKQFYEDIVKHSKNLIDLIEIGDIVNKGYIYEIGNAENGDRWIHNLNGLLLYEKDIKTILTKEQYMQNCYKLEEK